MRDLRVSFGPVDSLNPRCGYQVRVEDSATGKTLAFTANDPMTGNPLLTPADCMAVVARHVEGR